MNVYFSLFCYLKAVHLLAYEGIFLKRIFTLLKMFNVYISDGNVVFGLKFVL